MLSMKNTLLFILICTAPLYPRGSEDSCNYSSEPYHSVTMDIPCTLEIIKRETQDIEILGDRKLIKDLEITCKKGTVFLQSRNRSWTLRSRSDELRIVLYSPLLEEISCSSSGSIISRDSWEGKDLKISNRNSADIDLGGFSYETILIENKGSGDIHFQDLKSRSKLHIKAEGSGDISVKKLNSERVDISATGSGDLELDQLSCRKDTRLESRGSGSIYLNRIETPLLYLRSSGSGDIQLEGYATNADITAGGSGDINAADLRSDRLKVKENGSGTIISP